MSGDGDILSLLRSIEQKLDLLLAERDAPAREWLSLADASRLSGRSVQGVQGLLKRMAKRGAPLRRQHGKVNADDFGALLATMTRRAPATASAARAAVERIAI